MKVDTRLVDMKRAKGDFVADVLFYYGDTIPNYGVTNSDHDGIKYFSGTATYKKTFQYDIHSTALEQNIIYLDLGQLHNVGEVWLNGQSLGITWTKPYRFDVTDILKPRDNELKVEIPIPGPTVWRAMPLRLQ